MVESTAICAPVTVENGRVETVAALVVVGAVVLVMWVGVVDITAGREVFLVCAGTVVFHWWVENGLVTLAGKVMS